MSGTPLVVSSRVKPTARRSKGDLLPGRPGVLSQFVFCGASQVGQGVVDARLADGGALELAHGAALGRLDGAVADLLGVRRVVDPLRPVDEELVLDAGAVLDRHGRAPRRAVDGHGDALLPAVAREVAAQLGGGRGIERKGELDGAEGVGGDALLGPSVVAASAGLGAVQVFAPAGGEKQGEGGARTQERTHDEERS
jgi:hypothetical protein